MAAPLSLGRMIRKDISRSRGIAALSSEAMALFALLLPHFSSHGKVNGEPMFIKGEVCPLVPYLDLPTIERCLQEISDKTNVKWFEGPDNCLYLHALHFTDHQLLRKDKIGIDRMPSYPGSQSGTTPVLLRDQSGTSPPQVRPEVEVEVRSGSGSGSLSVSEKLKLKSAESRDGLEGPPASATTPQGIVTNILHKAAGNGDWKKTVPHLQEEVQAGRLTPKQARTGLVYQGAQISDVYPLFPDPEEVER